MWTDRRTGMRRLGTLALACVALAGAGILSLGWAEVARAQAGSSGAYIGVVLQDLDQNLRDSYGYHGSGGVLVSQVESGSPAERAGLERGDVILRFAGRSAGSAGDLTRAVRSRQPGESVAVTVWRDGRERALRITLGERPADLEEGGQVERGEQGEGEEQAPEIENPESEQPEAPEAPEAPAPPPAPMGNDIERRLEILIGRPRLGVEMQDLNPELGGYFERPSGKGVLVTRVLPDTPAKRAGLKAGDVIIELDGKTVDNADELRDRLDRAEAGPVRVTVLRRGQRQVLSAQLEKQDYRGLMAGREPRVFVRRLGPGAGGTWSFDSRDDLRRQMDDLKRQMDELKEQMQALKDQMEREAPGRR